MENDSDNDESYHFSGEEWGEDDEEGEEVEKAAAVEPDVEDIR